jgi:hypothetical protein
MPQDSLSLVNVLPPPPEIVRDSLAVLLVSSNTIPTKENLLKFKVALGLPNSYVHKYAPINIYKPIAYAISRT